jgi:beta-N-acetylhexosaminidase
MALADRAGVAHADLCVRGDPRLINDHHRCMRGLGGSVLAVRGVPRSAVRGRRGARVGVAAAMVIALAGCGAGSAPNSPSRTTATASPSPTVPTDTAPAPSSPRTTTTTACTTAQVVGGWPVSRLAAQVVTVPVLDFALANVTSEVRAGVGGVLFLGAGTAPADLGARVRALQGHAPAHTRLLVMADQEGGGVSRLSPLVSPVPWPRDMASTMTTAQVRALAGRVGRQMLAAGVTVDLAPVADVDARPGPSASNPDGARSFSGDPSTAAAYSIAFMQGLADAGVLPVVKHFPGLGGSTGNTDVGPSTTQPLTALTSSALVPFRAAVRAGAPAVMVSNASVPGLTRSPSSLSPQVIGDLLERDLDFHGLVVTDSLSAGAILTGGRTLAQATVEALAAGADLVLFGSTLTAADTAQLSATAVRHSYDTAVAALVAAVADDRLPVARLRAAALHVALAAHDNLCD